MGKQGKKRAHEGGRNKGLHMRWKEYQERGSIAVHVMHTCTGNRRRRGIRFYFWWENGLEHLEHHGYDLKRPGVLFVCIYITIYFIIFLGGAVG
jgi:hypothetical protein